MIPRNKIARKFEIMSQGRNSGSTGVVIYLPTKHFMSVLVDSCKLHSNDTHNPFKYPTNFDTENKCIDEDHKMFCNISGKVAEELKGKLC